MIEFRVLGRAELRDGERDQLASILAQPKRLAVLAYLCLAGRGGFVRRDELVAVFWPERDTKRARAALNQSLYVLRRTLGPEVIPGRGAEEVGVAFSELDCDATTFLDRLDRGDLAGALDLYDGDLLPALHLDSREADRWFEEMRADLRNRALAAARELGSEAAERGDLELACERYGRGLEIVPASESAARGLVESLWREGRRTAALEAFERFAARLSTEYGVEPGAELLELVERIRQGNGAQGGEQGPAAPGGSIEAVESAAPGVTVDAPATVGDGTDPPGPGHEARERASRRRRHRLAALALAAAAALAATHVAVGRRGAEPDALRLAVLPFDANGAELPDTLYAELLFLDVIDRMVGSGAHLISAVAIDRYAGLEDPVGSLREELDADVVWVTRWDREGPSARVRAELLDARSLVSLAATSVAVPPDRLERIVPRLAAWAADELDLTLAEAPYEPDPEARKLYLKAQMAWWREEYEGILELVEQATLLDPEYADAYALYSLILLQHTHLPAERTCDLYDALVPPAMEAARRALELDSTLVIPHVTLGHALWEHEFDVEGGRRELEIALELAPEDPDANMFYGWFLIVNGRPTEGLRYLERASEAYQLHPRFHHFRLLAYSFLGQEEQVEPYLQMLVTRFGRDSWAGYALRDYLLRQGDVEEASRLTVELEGDTTARPLEGRYSFALARGDMDTVDRLIERNIAEGELRLASLRSYRAGYHDQALDLLERWWGIHRACRSRMQMWLVADYPQLIGEPRLQAMADEVGIPWRESEVWVQMSD